MTKLFKKVNLKEPIDPDKLSFEKVYPDKELYAVELPLDSTPDFMWQECFKREYEIAVWNLQAKVTVSGDNLRLIAPSDEVDRNMIEGIKKLVTKTNQCVEEQNKEMLRREKVEVAKKKKEEETIKKMKGALK